MKEEFTKVQLSDLIPGEDKKKVRGGNLFLNKINFLEIVESNQFYRLFQ